MDLLYRYIHFLGILMAVGTLMGEMLLLRKRLTGAEVKRLGLLDGAFGASALLLVGGGLAQWFLGAKPSAFYSQNPVFLLKVGFVILVGGLSVYPTVWLLRHRKAEDAAQVTVPDPVRLVVRLEMALLLLIPLLAVLMARGIGHRG